MIKEIKEQYAWLWWWLLDKGIFVAWMIINFFLATVTAIVMVAVYYFLKWFSRH